MGRCWPGFGYTDTAETRRVDGFAVHAVMVGSQIIRHESGDDNHHRVE